MQLFHHLSEERRLLLQDWGKIYWFLALDSRANTVSRYLKYSGVLSSVILLLSVGT